MYEVKALAKGLQILDQLLEASMRSELHQGVGVTEVATHLKVNKSTASRLLKTLSRYGYAMREDDSRAYTLGPKMGQSVQGGSQTVFKDLARPFLYQLMKASGECAHSAILAQGKALIIDDVESASSLRVSGIVGRSEKLHNTAVGKCLLAFKNLPLPKALPEHTAKTITNFGELKKHIAGVKRQGYAFDDEENTEGVRCLAAPIYDGSNAVVGCIGISGPTVRMVKKRIPEYAEMVRGTAKELSHSLGYRE